MGREVIRTKKVCFCDKPFLSVSIDTSCDVRVTFTHSRKPYTAQAQTTLSARLLLSRQRFHSWQTLRCKLYVVRSYAGRVRAIAMVTERCSCEQLMLDEQLADVPYCRPPTDSSGSQEGIEGGGGWGGSGRGGGLHH